MNKAAWAVVLIPWLGCGGAEGTLGGAAAAAGSTPGSGFGSPSSLASAGGASGASSGPSSLAGSSGSGTGGNGSNPAVPDRVVFFYVPHGTMLESWRPSAVGTTFTLGPILEPLTPFQSKLVVIDGLQLSGAEPCRGVTHSCLGFLLSAASMVASPTAGRFYPTGPTLDQVLAQEFNEKALTQLSSLEFGVFKNSVPEAQDYLSFSARSSDKVEPITPVSNPHETVARLLSGLDPNVTTAKNLPDQVVNDIRSNLSQLPKDFGPADYQKVTQLQIDLILLALATEQTRVVSLAFDMFTSLSAIDGTTREYLNSLAHGGDDGNLAATRQNFVNVQRWYAQQFALLLAKLEAYPQSDGKTLLDHTLVVWVTDTGEAPTHGVDNVPVVLAGNVSGRIRTGQSIKTTRHFADLLLTIGKAMGSSMTTFGDPKFDAKPIDEILQ